MFYILRIGEGQRPVVITLSREKVPIGAQVMITCEKSKATVGVSLLHNGSAIITSTRITSSSQGVNSIWTINSVILEDQGVYQCSVGTQSDTDSNSLLRTLDVIAGKLQLEYS